VLPIINEADVRRMDFYCLIVSGAALEAKKFIYIRSRPGKHNNI